MTVKYVNHGIFCLFRINNVFVSDDFNFRAELFNTGFVLTELDERSATLIIKSHSVTRNRDVISSIDKEFAEKIDQSQIKNFRYVYDDIVQLIDMVATYRDILTGSLDIYVSSVSNNLNTIIKRMTAFASIILVPTFITGLYGMNFKFMPEIGWKYGYMFAWGTILFSIVFLIIYFKKKDWF